MSFQITANNKDFQMDEITHSLAHFLSFPRAFSHTLPILTQDGRHDFDKMYEGVMSHVQKRVISHVQGGQGGSPSRL